VAATKTSGNFFRPSPQYTAEVDDVELLHRARRGGEVAFTQLFARHQRVIFRYALHMCGRDAADDIVQETFLAVLKQSGNYDASRGPVVAYLLGIARHSVLKRIGAPGGFPDDIDDHAGVLSAPPTALDDLSREESVIAVRAAVESLPPVFREAVVLCELEEMDYASAAGVIGCPIGTVRSRLSRARAMLTTKLAAMRPVARMARS
jgi:RNA polymerase sigma-70 factor (ECF subfamily)